MIETTVLDAEFNDYRGRIAQLSMVALETLTDMFVPLSPVSLDVDLAETFEDTPLLIDVAAIEWDQFEVELARTMQAEQDMLASV